mgnify:CR=1 FL=1
MELEEAMQRRKDPRSFSQILCCKLCLTGPSEKSCSARVANVLHFMMIAFNVLTLFYTMNDKWTWLILLNIGLGCITSLLMWCVQCSDPGIINRE